MKKKKFLVPTAIITVCAFVLGILFATAGANLIGRGDNIGTDIQAASNLPTAERSDLEQSFIDIAAAVNPAVVQIRPRRAQTPLPMGRGIGSGVIISEDGYIVTNHHVINGASDIDVVLEDGHTMQAEIVGSDFYVDLAVLKITGENLPMVSFGRADDIRIGQWVMAFGSPLSEELKNTVTVGIVSGKGRVSNLNLGSELIQTDAVINPGNSGGPLVNLQGQLIGINTLIATRTGVYNGIGFAVPVNTVANAVEQIRTTGVVQYGYLGLGFDRVPQPLTKALGISPGAAQVTEVINGEAADRAGILAGDIITAINGEELRHFNHLRTRIGSYRPGEEILLEIVRDGQPLEVEVRLGTRDDIAAVNENSPQSRGGPRNFDTLGLTLEDFDPERARELLNLRERPQFRGAFIREIAPNSGAAQDAMLMSSDVIIEADQQPVDSAEDFARILSAIGGGETIQITAMRYARGPGDEGRFITFKTALEKPE